MASQIISLLHNISFTGTLAPGLYPSPFEATVLLAVGVRRITWYVYAYWSVALATEGNFRGEGYIKF